MGQNILLLIIFVYAFSQTTFAKDACQTEVILVSGQKVLQKWCPKNSETEGTLIRYFPKSKRAEVVSEVKGELKHGLYKKYYPNGKLERIGEYKSDLMVGTWKRFYPDGSLKDVVKWREGVPEGYWEQFDQDGNLQTTGRFSCGQPLGVWRQKIEDKFVSEFKLPTAQCVKKDLWRFRTSSTVHSQGSLGSFNSVSFSWAPEIYKTANWITFAGLASISPVKNQSDSFSLISNLSLLASWATPNMLPWGVEGKLGLSHFGERVFAPNIGIGIEYLNSKIFESWFDRIVGSYALLLHPVRPIHQISLGFQMRLF